MNKKQSHSDANWTARWTNALVSLHSKLFDASGNLKPEFAQFTNCPVCGSGDSREYCVKDKFIYHTCRSCGMVYMNPRLNTQATLAFYNCPANEIYNEAKFHAVSAGTATDDKANYENLQLITKHIENNGQGGKLNGKRILEIGCAKGYFLNSAKELGAEAFGIELNQKNVEIARQAHGANIYDRDLFELNLPEKSFDVIYTRDVIEHIHEPVPFLKEISRLLKPGGMVFTETHNIDGLIHRIVRDKHACIFGFEHPVHWSPKTLSLALRNSGLETRNVYFESRDFMILNILEYYMQSSFTTVFSWKKSGPLEVFLKAASFLFRLPVLRTIDRLLMPPLANYFKAGSTMKVMAYKPQDPIRGIA